MNAVDGLWTVGFWSQDNAFHLPVRVYYEDTDAGGIVYHSIYLNYAERARTEFVRALGIHQQSILDQRGLAFAVRRCTADFRRPARLDDMLIVRTRLVELRGASLDFEQTILRGDEVLVDYAVQIACITTQGRAVRFPADLRDSLLKGMAVMATAS
ncbi:tol-pal system-associated acyl-CoA thioesterase [Insolitispirillum peregrinum]|uniref:tol-pal system-associated acyl-CoA thioesterase n=1 Tax=Insolitispirillum peregrinum TaxID=80876 RepID=UPI0036080947